jgi:aromatic-L-amino-acid decarboxylase
LVRTLEISPEYLKTRRDAAVTNFRDWGIPLGRRFRALKLWFVIRSYGVDGLREKLRAHIAWAKELADHIDAAPDFELLRAPRLSLLCFRYRPESGERGDELNRINEHLLNRLNDSGRLYVTHTLLEGEYAIRFVVGQTSTERRHVRGAWELIQETARNAGS